MKKLNNSLFALAIVTCLMISLPVAAQSPSESPGSSGGTVQGSSDSAGSSFFNQLLSTAGQALNQAMKEEFDKWLGTYDGRIEQVRLLEQTPDSVVLEVTYRGIRRRDGVSAKGEVLRGGYVLPGFTSTLGQVQGREGIARLTISREAATGWDTGTTPATETSDQLRLYLVRSDYPDRHFGELVYDFPRTWGEETAYGQDSYGSGNQYDNGGAIELGGDTGNQGGLAGTGSNPPVLKPVIKPGMVLMPVKQAKPAGSTTSQGNKPALQVKPLGIPVSNVKAPVYRYDMFRNASKALWKNELGKTLHFPGRTTDRSGYAIPLQRAKVSSRGVAATKVIEMRTPARTGGYIEARYPVITPGKEVRFRTTVGIPYGLAPSDSVLVMVYVYEVDKRHYTLKFRDRLFANSLVPVMADLRRFAGSRIQIILKVQSEDAYDSDVVCWIAPRIEPR